MHTLQACVHRTRLRMLLRMSASLTTSARSASATGCKQLEVTDRWPRATGLVSYPSSCLSLLAWTTPLLLGRASQRSDLIASPCFPPASRRLHNGPLNPRCSIPPFSQPGCDTGRIRRRFVRSKPPGSGSPHWLTVATDSRRSTDCVRLKARNHGPAEA